MIPHSKPWITIDDEGKVRRQLLSGLLADGSTVREFERALSADLALPNIWFMASGTAALHLALRAIDAKPGDEIILPTYVCQAVLNAIELAGFHPKFCDVGPDWVVDPENIDKCMTRRSKAILLTNGFGFAVDACSFRQFGLPIINDLAQSFDAAMNDVQDSQYLGDIVVFSFHVTKCLTTGRGGAIATANGEYKTAIGSAVKNFKSISSGDDLHAALGLAQLSRYPQFRKRREILANRFFQELPGDLTFALSSSKVAWHRFRFPLRQNKVSFEVFATRMAALGVIVRRGIDTLLHRQCGSDDALFRNSVQCFDETVSIPIYPALSEGDAEKIIYACNTVWNSL